MNRTPPPQGQPPPGYREVLYWKISEKLSRVLLMNLLSIPLFVLWGIAFFWLVGATSKLPEIISLSRPIEWLIFLMAIPAATVLHELVHGLTMRGFGAHPKYGFLWKSLAFYATSPGYAFPRRQYVSIALAPLVILSVVAVVLIAFSGGTTLGMVIAFAAALNASGAIGDLWITAVVLRFPAHAYVIDERDGMRILLKVPGSLN